MEDGGRTTARRRPSVQNQVEGGPQGFRDLSSVSGRWLAAGVGAGGSEATAGSAGKGAGGGEPAAAPRHARTAEGVSQLGPQGDDQGQWSRPKPLGQHRHGGWDRRAQGGQLVEIGDDDGKCLVRMAPFHREDPLTGLAIQRVGSQAIKRLGRVGDDAALPQELSGPPNDVRLRPERIDSNDLRHPASVFTKKGPQPVRSYETGG